MSSRAKPKPGTVQRGALPPRQNTWWPFALAVIALGGVAAYLLTTERAQGPRSTPEPVSTQTDTASPGAPPSSEVGTPAPAAPDVLPPLPAVTYAPSRPWPVVQAAYEFAARHPEILHYVPCFCGCEGSGHRANDDCFVTSRDKAGQPTWNPHGIACSVCIDVAVDARRMYESGASLADIRATIERTYRAQSPTMTPTPPVPHEGTQ